MRYQRAKFKRRRKKKMSKFSKGVIYFLLILIILSGVVGYQLYNAFLKPNTWVKDENTATLYIPTGSTFEELKKTLYGKGIIINRLTFEWMSKRKNLDTNIHPGKYLISDGMTNIELINLLRSGKQIPVKLIFNNIRTKADLAKKIASDIEPDSANIINLLNDSAFLSIFGFSPETILTMFIPNTYEVYWNITGKEVMDRMYTEYNKFWNAGRRQKAEKLGLTPVEVSILASIVERETNKNDEKARMAGVYLNRLEKNWMLQADPTVVFAWGDFSIKRVLNVQKEIDSPYNTYKNYGLPPGPICIPSISSIDGVLDREEHKYMFFCAKDDFSGYHVFAENNTQHSINANKYRRALDKMNIKK
jgi:UPF0755 protein